MTATFQVGMRDLPVLLARLEQLICRRKDPSCPICPIGGDCPSAGHPPPLY
jgi:endonuclease III